MARETGKAYIFPFGGGANGAVAPRAILGFKGAALMDLARTGLPVPPGFTLSAEVCAYALRHGGQLPAGLAEALRANLRRLEEIMGRRFGDPDQPLLLAVRTGTGEAAPGLLPAVLNLGMNDQSVRGFAAWAGEIPAWDCYRRFLARFGAGVAGLPAADFVAEERRVRGKCGLAANAPLSAAQLRDLCDAFKRLCSARLKKSLPENPMEQLLAVLQAAFSRWARAPAEPARAAGLLGVAAHVQAMVFGNLGPDGGAGRAFSRDPKTGAALPSGSYLVHAQGDDLDRENVAARSLDRMAEDSPGWRAVQAELLKALRRLEERHHYPQQVEFTVERGRLWLLQTRPAPRSGLAGARWVVEMALGRDAVTRRALEKNLRPEQALALLESRDLEALQAAGRTAAGRTLANKLHAHISDWADRFGHVSIRVFVESPAGLPAALAAGARGAGPVRLDRWFQEPARARAVRELALIADPAEGEKAAEKLWPPLCAEMEKWFRAADGRPLAVRLYVPGSWRTPARTGPEAPRPAACAALVALQARAVFEAACRIEKNKLNPQCEFLIPFSGQGAVFAQWVAGARATAEAVIRRQRARLRCHVGALIETPRGALTAEEAAEHADSILFDAAPLARLVCGWPAVEADEVAPAGFDLPGLGRLIELAARNAREARPDVVLGMLGDLCADAHALRFLDRIGIHYVICSARRLSVARLAAAQAAIKSR